MKKTTLPTRALLLLGFVGLSVACSQSGSNQETVQSSLSFPQKGNFRLSLTDAPHPTLTSVYVNIDHVELLLEKEGKQGRLILGQNMGSLDLLKLRDGVHLPIKDLNLKESVVVKQFRLILKDDGHFLVRKDSSTCNMKTPSQQRTGLKLLLPQGGVEIEPDSIYSLIVDFDVDHSVVDNQSNCLLKPVLKVKTLAKVPASSDDSTSPDGSGNSSGDDTSSGSTGNDSSAGTDSSTGSGSSAGNDSSTGTDSNTGGASDGSTDGSTDGSVDGTGDGAPIVNDGDPQFFN